APLMLRACAIRTTSTSIRLHIVITPVDALKTGRAAGVPVSSALTRRLVPRTFGQWIRTELLPFLGFTSVMLVLALVRDEAAGPGPPAAFAQRAVGEPAAAAPNNFFSSPFPCLNAVALSS